MRLLAMSGWEASLSLKRPSYHRRCSRKSTKLRWAALHEALPDSTTDYRPPNMSRRIQCLNYPCAHHRSAKLPPSGRERSNTHAQTILLVLTEAVIRLRSTSHSTTTADLLLQVFIIRHLQITTRAIRRFSFKWASARVLDTGIC